MHPDRPRHQEERLKRAVNGARKMRPPMSRLGLVEAVWMAMIGAAESLGHHNFAMMIVVSVELYLRPSEAINALISDLAGPSGAKQLGLEHFTLTLAPSNTLQRTTTGVQDDTLIVDQ
eukprot:7881225-Karenia_brevis.AAC.1